MAMTASTHCLYDEEGGSGFDGIHDRAQRKGSSVEGGERGSIEPTTIIGSEKFGRWMYHPRVVDGKEKVFDAGLFDGDGGGTWVSQPRMTRKRQRGIT